MSELDQLKLSYLAARQKHVNAKTALTTLASQAKEKSQWIMEIAGSFSAYRNQEAILAESEWPTFQQIIQAMSEFRSSRKDVDTAWKAIPEEERGGLQPVG